MVRITDPDVPMIFIASPLFNPVQIAIIVQIESLITEAGFRFYSARLDSGSNKLSAEEKRVLKNWDPVFKSNTDGLDESVAMLAVLEYALPEGSCLALCSEIGNDEAWVPTKRLEIPDAGTVWEMGYHAGQNSIRHLYGKSKPILGFHSTKRAEHLNLMLTHGVHGLISGFDNLRSFLTQPHSLVIGRKDCLVVNNLVTCGLSENVVPRFNWTACEDWDREVE